jgi:hypothetical protein
MGERSPRLGERDGLMMSGDLLVLRENHGLPVGHDPCMNLGGLSGQVLVSQGRRAQHLAVFETLKTKGWQRPAAVE